MKRNEGVVYVGKSADTPEFAGEAITRWWASIRAGGVSRGDTPADLDRCGGSNGCRPRLWKEQLQSQLSDAWGLSVTVCHYPIGCSKWHPIEQRLFSQMSINGAGKPLRTFETMLGLIRGTTTQSGLEVLAHMHEGVFEKGKKVTDAVMKTLNMTRHETCPQWNYTMHPRLGHTSGA